MHIHTKSHSNKYTRSGEKKCIETEIERRSQNKTAFTNPSSTASCRKTNFYKNCNVYTEKNAAVYSREFLQSTFKRAYSFSGMEKKAKAKLERNEKLRIFASKYNTRTHICYEIAEKNELKRKCLLQASKKKHQKSENHSNNKKGNIFKCTKHDSDTI